MRFLKPYIPSKLTNLISPEESNFSVVKVVSDWFEPISCYIYDYYSNYFFLLDQFLKLNLLTKYLIKFIKLICNIINLQCDANTFIYIFISKPFYTNPLGRKTNSDIKTTPIRV